MKVEKSCLCVHKKSKCNQISCHHTDTSANVSFVCFLQYDTNVEHDCYNWLYLEFLSSHRSKQISSGSCFFPVKKIRWINPALQDSVQHIYYMFLEYSPFFLIFVCSIEEYVTSWDPSATETFFIFSQTILYKSLHPRLWLPEWQKYSRFRRGQERHGARGRSSIVGAFLCLSRSFIYSGYG